MGNREGSGRCMKLKKICKLVRWDERSVTRTVEKYFKEIYEVEEKESPDGSEFPLNKIFLMAEIGEIRKKFNE